MYYLLFLLFVTVHDASALVAESGEESEDEWNYYKGDTADKENYKPTDADAEVCFKRYGLLAITCVNVLYEMCMLSLLKFM